ncbi:MAG TPA: winged helix-turn-helix transcriptional regulator [Xanthobacteraceae bacterium]|nr:winged helix-turn-helix transcriptional regulator [Xanthobacteraceae bacterium]
MLELLGAVERGGVTQRRLSRELGIAVGLVNAYIKRCISKGFVKVRQVPPRRYAYYLTPKGFLEKSRLVADYFIYSFEFFRRARDSCKAALSSAAEAEQRRIALMGISELTEIATIVAPESEVEIIAVVDPKWPKSRFLRIPVYKQLAEVSPQVDAVLVTALAESRSAYETAINAFGPSRVHIPSVIAEIDRSQRLRLELGPKENPR